ncbi:hypothetical protein PCAR4_120031 [Paraburkholderia caribensis]|nr:hypothetical protein PCAR4_120031 [Paraburkholderia caribensis]
MLTGQNDKRAPVFNGSPFRFEPRLVARASGTGVEARGNTPAKAGFALRNGTARVASLCVDIAHAGAAKQA